VLLGRGFLLLAAAARHQPSLFFFNFLFKRVLLTFQFIADGGHNLIGSHTHMTLDAKTQITNQFRQCLARKIELSGNLI
jgi:hypothetical protein